VTNIINKGTVIISTGISDIWLVIPTEIAGYMEGVEYGG